MIKDLRYYAKISKVGDVARRYFVMNAFDGTLTILGILLGSYFVVGVQPHFVVSAGLGAVFAMVISGFAGTFMTETAERKNRLTEIEKMLLRKLKGTEQEKSAVFASIYAALVDGTSPALAALICILPYIAGLFGFLQGEIIFYSSVLISTVILFTLGFYLGKLSREDTILMGLKMVFMGLIIGILSLMIDFLFK